MSLKKEYACKACDQLLGYPVGSAFASHAIELLESSGYIIGSSINSPDDCYFIDESIPVISIPFVSTSDIWPFGIGINLSVQLIGAMKDVFVSIYFPEPLSIKGFNPKEFILKQVRLDLIDFDCIGSNFKNFDVFGKIQNKLKNTLGTLKQPSLAEITRWGYDLRSIIQYIISRQTHTSYVWHFGMLSNLYCSIHDGGRWRNAADAHYRDDVLNCRDCNILLESYLDYLRAIKNSRNATLVDFMVENLSV